MKAPVYPRGTRVLLLCFVLAAGCQKKATQAAPAGPPPKGADGLDAEGLVLPWPAQARLGSARGTHTHEIRDMVASPGGAGFVMAVGRRIILLEGGTDRARTLELPCSIHSLATDQSGARIAAVCRQTFSDGDEPERVLVASADGQGPPVDFRLPEALVAVAWVRLADAEALLLGARSGKLYLTDPAGRVLRSWKVFEGRESEILSNTFVALLPHPGRPVVLAIGEERNLLVSLDADTVRELILPGDTALNMAAWLPGEADLALVATDEGLDLWRLGDEPTPVARGAARLQSEEGDGPFWLGASADGRRVLALTDDGLQTFSREGKKLSPLASLTGRTDLAALSADGRWVLATGSLPLIHHLLPADRLRPPADRHATPIALFALSPDGQRVASLDFDGVLFVRALTGGGAPARFEIRPPTQDGLVAKRMFLAWLGPDRLLLGHHKQAQVVTLSSGALQPLGQAAFAGVEKLAAAASGQRLVTLDRFGGRAALWQVQGDGLEAVWQQKYDNRGLYRDTPCGVGMSADGSAFFVQARSANSGLLTVFDPRGQPIRKFEASTSCEAALSGDGQRVAIATDRGRGVRVYEVASGREIHDRSMGERSWETVLAEVDGLALDAQGEHLATVWLDKILFVPLAAPDTARHFSSPFGSRQLVFLPDGRLLSGEISSLLVWKP